MIITFAGKETEKVYSQNASTKLPQNIQKSALKKLMYLDNATNINDLFIPPSNHLEKLSGNLEGKWSIRINDQWRVVRPSDDWKQFYEVEIVDYH